MWWYEQCPILRQVLAAVVNSKHMETEHKLCELYLCLIELTVK